MLGCLRFDIVEKSRENVNKFIKSGFWIIEGQIIQVYCSFMF